MLINIPLNRITEEDLLNIIGEEEGPQVEYKEALPGGSDEDVKEFLKDVSALANTHGGDIYYGMREDLNSNGHTVAVELNGIEGIDADSVVRRFESLIRDCIKPRLVGQRIKPVHLSNGKTLFIVRVPRSWNGPHVVERGRHWRFYYRNSAGSHPMDISEVRNAMLFSDNISQKMESFRLDRLSKILADDSIRANGKIVLHLQPLDSVNPEMQVDLAIVREYQHRPKPIYQWTSAEYESRPNFDGYFTTYEGGAKEYGYVQVFRSGIIEAVDTRMLSNTDRDIPCLILEEFEEQIRNAIQRYFDLARTLGVLSPIRVHLSLLGVKGYILSRGDTRYMGDFPGLNAIIHFSMVAQRRPIDRPDLLFRGMTIEDLEVSADQIVEQWLDAIWNAVGLDRNGVLPFA